MELIAPMVWLGSWVFIFEHLCGNYAGERTIQDEHKKDLVIVWVKPWLLPSFLSPLVGIFHWIWRCSNVYAIAKVWDNNTFDEEGQWAYGFEVRKLYTMHSKCIFLNVPYDALAILPIWTNISSLTSRIFWMPHLHIHVLRKRVYRGLFLLRVCRSAWKKSRSNQSLTR